MGYADREAQREYQRLWVAGRRASFFADKKCEWCPSTTKLELHHRDMNKKLTHNVWSWNATRRDAEIAKCIVVCQSCHHRAHSEARRIEAELRHPHGTLRRYALGCKCADCLRAKAEDSRYRNIRRKERLGFAPRCEALQAPASLLGHRSRSGSLSADFVTVDAEKQS